MAVSFSFSSGGPSVCGRRRPGKRGGECVYIEVGGCWCRCSVGDWSLNMIDGPGPSSAATLVLGTGLDVNLGCGCCHMVGLSLFDVADTPRPALLPPTRAVSEEDA